MGAAPAPAAALAAAPAAHVRAWSTFVRELFVAGRFYAFATWPRVLFHVVLNKVRAGRPERFEGDAMGRDLVVTFFERVPGTSAAHLTVQRVDKSIAGMSTRLLTVA